MKSFSWNKFNSDYRRLLLISKFYSKINSNLYVLYSPVIISQFLQLYLSYLQYIDSNNKTPETIQLLDFLTLLILSHNSTYEYFAVFLSFDNENGLATRILWKSLRPYKVAQLFRFSRWKISQLIWKNNLRNLVTFFDKRETNKILTSFSVVLTLLYWIRSHSNRNHPRLVVRNLTVKSSIIFIKIYSEKYKQCIIYCLIKVLICLLTRAFPLVAIRCVPTMPKFGRFLTLNQICRR